MPSRIIPALLLLLSAACTGTSGRDDDNTSTCTKPGGCTTKRECADGEAKCGSDGFYTCTAEGQFLRVSECVCDSTPNPHCRPDPCDGGATTVCDGDNIRICASGAIVACNGGRCILDGDAPVCATKAGDPVCVRNTATGDVRLLCSDGDVVATNQVCDVRSGRCAPSTFDCTSLASVEQDKLACDDDGSFHSRCSNGQPWGVVCPAGTACAGDGTFNCYTAARAGESCGGQKVCYPGLHCTQTSATVSTCVQPAGVLACSASDVLSICNDTDTALACVEGTVYWWKNLTNWGGSCSGDTPSIPAGGNCIPGVADCNAGLACNMTPYDTAGTCGTPEPGAPPECTLTTSLSTGLSCQYRWNSCRNGHTYGVSCQVNNIAGHVITICSCLVDGEKGGDFAGKELCGVADVASLDALTAEKCAWQVKTTGVRTGG